MSDAASPNGTAPDKGAAIDVCICTYKRPSIVQTLESIAAQRGLDDASLRVVVADNDVEPRAQDLVTETCRRLGLNCFYVHAPAQNISIARNACLDAATAPLAVFIDDDEEAAPDWIAQLLEGRRSTGAQVVFGAVKAVYPPDAPGWLARADLHSTKATVRGGERVESGYTCNVLFERAALGGDRFDLALGRSGGEDTVFFNRLYRRGVRLAFWNGALVTEFVPPQRGKLSWLLKRSFRSGQTHGALLLERGAPRLKSAAVAAVKAGYCLAGAGLGLMSPAAWRRALVRGALHAGAVARLLGRKELELY